MRRFSLLFAVLLCLAATAAVAAPAQAGVLVSTTTSCTDGAYERPFLRWLDPLSYVLAPSGSFESGTAGWTLSGAGVAAGNETYYVHGGRDRYSLSLPGGSQATSRAMCVGLLHPTLRLFVRNSGSLLSTLRVEALFEDAGGQVRALTLGVVAGTAAWQPTLPMPVVANLLPLLPGNYTPVAFRFTPLGSGGRWQIDDVYVDPRRSR